MQTEITKLLGIEYPIIQGGMAWVAEHHFGCSGKCGRRTWTYWRSNAPAEVVRNEIREARKAYR